MYSYTLETLKLFRVLCLLLLSLLFHSVQTVLFNTRLSYLTQDSLVKYTRLSYLTRLSYQGIPPWSFTRLSYLTQDSLVKYTRLSYQGIPPPWSFTRLSYLT